MSAMAPGMSTHATEGLEYGPISTFKGTHRVTAISIIAGPGDTALKMLSG